MRVLLLTHAFNGLTQRLYVELAERGHALSVEFDINDEVTREAVELFAPDVVLAPFLKRAIPEDVWRRVPCLVVHPGIVGDRGPSALDWAILGGERDWGVTLLQANAAMDAGDIWASASFPMRSAPKSSLYRNEVAEAAVRCVLEALERLGEPGFTPRPLDPDAPDVRGRLRPLARQADRVIDWAQHGTAEVLARIHSADGFPGLVDEVLGLPCRLYGGWPETDPPASAAGPGAVIAVRDGAILTRTRDAAVWISHLRAEGAAAALKLPAVRVLGERAAGLPEWQAPLEAGPEAVGFRELRYFERGPVGFLEFDFLNGAMSTDQCQRLRAALVKIRQRPTRVLVLLGGREFWANGIHLGTIEAATHPADESWQNINAIDDVCLEILSFNDKIVVSALRGNAAAGGAFLALAADEVWARAGIVLNPHYKNMGNLYGSEYWTYLLPRRVGADAIARVMGNRLPIGTAAAQRLGLLDAVIDASREDFLEVVAARARALASADDFGTRLAARNDRRAAEWAEKPLDRYRAAELERMRLNFYGFDPSYHVARHRFVHRTPHSWTPRHLAAHRCIGADGRRETPR
jgi:putative two-component system protein, hydrogenase maturation factor HypX/HoxX